MNTGVIDQFLNTFTTYIDSGFGLLSGEVGFLATTLVAIDMTLAALFWAWSPGEEILARLIRKTLYVGFFSFIIGNFNGLAKIVFTSFSGLGLKAAGASLSSDQFLQPGRIAQVGIDAGTPILQAASSLAGFSAVINPGVWVQLAVLLVAFLAVTGSFFVLAIQLFVALIEFKLTTLAGFVLVPFGLFGPTAFLAERVLGNVAASGVKILVLAVVVGIGTGLFSGFTAAFGGNQPTLQDVLALVLAALSLLGLALTSPGVASGLASGAPQLGAGAAIGTAQVAAGAGRAAPAILKTTAAAAAVAGAAVMRGAASLMPLARGGAGGAGGSDPGGPPQGPTQDPPKGPSKGPPGGPPGGPPEWARQMRRRQALSEGLGAGLGALGRTLREGGRGGAGRGVNLKGDGKGEGE